MKKAFDANVSRTRPRLRFGAAGSFAAPESQPLDSVNVDAIAAQVAREEAPVARSPSEELSAALKARAASHARRPTADELLNEALSEQPQGNGAGATAQGREQLADDSFVSHLAVEEPEEDFGPPRTVAQVEPPPEVVEVQTVPAPAVDQAARRDRLKSRLRAVRENPRPEPLPDTVAEAGVRAVERIALLQTELTRARELNLGLTQDLEAARRQAERATEEARLRMDEAKRLAAEMETRAALLTELEHELEALEAERNEALIAVQDGRLRNEAQEKEKAVLEKALGEKDKEVEECLAEEERLAAELEATRQTAASMRRSAEILTQERDTLARQVAELTRERAELLEARKALEAVHRALSSAAVR